MKVAAFVFVIIFFLAGCASNQKVQQSVSRPQITPAENSAPQNMTSGTDFFASGETPVNWQLNIQTDDRISFTAANGEKLSMQTILPTVTAGYREYNFKDIANELNVRISNSLCAAGNTKVTVVANGKTYSGCGGYTLNPSLAGSWQMTKINNVELQRRDFKKGLPVFTFDLAAKAVQGTDGCNQFTSSFTPEGSRLLFADFIFKGNACAALLPRIFMQEQLHTKRVVYRINQNSMQFFLEDDSRIDFVRQ